MKEIWLLQLENIKKVIDGSLVSLQNLVKQSNDLQAVIELTGIHKEGSGKSAEHHRQLESIKKAIDDDISSLVAKIGELFAAYNALLGTIFD